MTYFTGCNCTSSHRSESTWLVLAMVTAAIVLNICGAVLTLPFAPYAYAEDVARSQPSSNPSLLTALNDELLFVADNGVHGRELWRSNILGQCTLVEDLVPGASGSNPYSLSGIGGEVYFVAERPNTGIELHVYDSAEKTIKRFIDMSKGAYGSGPTILRPGAASADFMSVLFGGGLTKHTLCRIWTGSHKVEEIRRLDASQINEVFYCYDSEGTLYMDIIGAVWKAPANGTDFEPIWPGKRGQSKLSLLKAVDGRVAFSGYDDEHGGEPWIYNAASGQLSLLKDINPGPTSTNMMSGYVHDRKVYFSAGTESCGLELWVTDFTSDGTRMVRDINPGGGDSDPHYFASVGETLYFVAQDGTHGKEIWRTDGTEEGTRLVCDLWPGAPGSEPWSPVSFQGRLYFCANSSRYGEELFATDGTTQGTGIVADIIPGKESSGPNSLTPVGDVLFFSARDLQHGEELWMSYGMGRETRLAADINGPSQQPSSRPRHLRSWRDKLYFIADDERQTPSLWTSDGTADGTILLAPCGEGEGHRRPFEISRDRVYYASADPSHGEELWVIDSTPGEAQLLKDICPGPASSSPHDFMPYDACLAFLATDSAGKAGVWITDGTAANTLPLTAPIPKKAERMTVVQDRLFILSSDDRQTHLLDTFLLPTVIPSDPNELIESTRYALASSSVIDFRAWVRRLAEAGLDRTAIMAAAIPLTLPKDRKAAATADGNAIVLAAHGLECGYELFQTDGTPDGTTLIVDAFPGPASSNPANFTWYHGELYFIAEHPEEGQVIWRYRPALNEAIPLMPLLGNFRTRLRAREFAIAADTLLASGPNPMADDPANASCISVGLAGPSTGLASILEGFGLGQRYWPQNLTAVGNDVFFVADDGVVGSELWIYDTSELGARLVKDLVSR